ncbi:hypothetical protein C2W62_07230 [Candidatus Entotheonella serta]|nr:hypothetical protein C2W62_07230 [Candidatus Entotheonella serta]
MKHLGSDLYRFLHIIAVVIRHLCAYFASQYVAGRPWLARRMPCPTLSPPERLRRVFEELGGTFIKFGQLLALQPDILPVQYCNALFDLLDHITPFEFDEVEKVFIEQFGQGPGHIFDRFELQPIATASIGQVYVAYLDEQKLAVKVQRPNVKAEFAGDIRLMTTAIRIIRCTGLKKLYWLIEPLKEFVAWTHEELDFRYEARYMEQLRHNAHDNPNEYIPEVIWAYTSHNVLTAEFLEGETLLNYIRALENGDEVTVRRLQATGFDPDEFARHIIDNFLYDAFGHGIFHADLHPANLIILPNNTVGYVDFGITGMISPYFRRHLIALTGTYTRGDLEGMYQAYLKISALDEAADVDAFRRGIEALSNDWYNVEGHDRRLLKNLTIVMFDLLTLSRQTGVLPERGTIKCIRSTIALDGLITRFVPTFDVGNYLEMASNGYLEWYVRQELLSFNTLINWSTSSGNLMRDGLLRAVTALERLIVDGSPVLTAVPTVPVVRAPAQHQAVHLGALVFLISLLITVTGQPVQWGVNLFTAEVVLLGAATIRFLRTIGLLIERQG